MKQQSRGQDCLLSRPSASCICLGKVGGREVKTSRQRMTGGILEELGTAPWDGQLPSLSPPGPFLRVPHLGSRCPGQNSEWRTQHCEPNKGQSEQHFPEAWTQADCGPQKPHIHPSQMRPNCTRVELNMAPYTQCVRNTVSPNLRKPPAILQMRKKRKPPQKRSSGADCGQLRGLYGGHVGPQHSAHGSLAAKSAWQVKPDVPAVVKICLQLQKKGGKVT